MKLLYYAPDLYPQRGGYSSACTAFAEAVSRDGRVELDVITHVPLGGATELELGPRSRVVRLDDLPIGRAAALARQATLSRALKRELRAGGHDLVMLETAEFPWAGRAVERSHPGRVITRVHAVAETEWVLFRDHWQYAMKRDSTRRFFRAARGIFATSPYYIDFVRRRFLDDDPILAASKAWAVVPNVLRDERSSASGVAAASGDLTFLTLGRMDALGEGQKNFGRLLLALARLRGRPYFDRLRLSIVGQGPRRAALETLAREVGVEKSVEFRSEMPGESLGQAQRTASGVILASTYEGVSMFALESLAQGAPLLFADVGGLRDLVDDGVNGVTFDPFSVESIAAALDRFIRELAPRDREVRAASRAKFEREFSAGITIDRFVRASEDVLAQRRAGL